MKTLHSLVEPWTKQLNELGSKLNGYENKDYASMQAEYIRLQKCLIQVQNVILNKMPGRGDVPDSKSDHSVVLPESVLQDAGEHNPDDVAEDAVSSLSVSTP